jgi:malonate transporter and related proteins
VTIIISPLLPVIVTLLLGYLAAWYRDQDSTSSHVLNKAVMTYTLPLSLFAGTVTMSRDQLVANPPMGAAMLAGLAIPFAAALAIARYMFHRGLGESTLRARGISFPAVPFIGLPVLGTIFGTQAATLAVAIGGLITNLIIVPASIILRALTPTVSAPIVASTALRLAVVPALAFLVFPLAGVTGKAMSDSVVALAMPCAVMLIILSVRYRIAEKASASVLPYSYLFSAVSMTSAVLLTT